MTIPAQLLAPSRMKLDTTALSERSADQSFADMVREKIGSLDGYTVMGSSVLVATYIKPRKTAGGIFLTEKTVDEDRWQGKVGLVLKLGEDAFRYTYTSGGAYDYTGPKPEVGTYIAFHTSDAREVGIKGISCKLIDASLIKLIVPNPDDIY
jgi:hypothetical protein